MKYRKMFLAQQDWVQGSACRSMYGGWVQWCKGQDKSGHDSIAKQIVPASHWPDMRVLILVVSDNKKKDGSTDGMRRSRAITEAIKNKNFAKFAEITMQDSNQFHAICLDTYPPCVYMNDTSHAIVQLVHSYNTYKLSVKVAYTFDAGPNACLYLLEQDVEEFMSLVNYVFPSSNKDEYIRGLPLTMKPVPEGLKLSMDLKQSSHHLKYIIHTKIGEGPKVIHDSAQHLLTETGLPKYFVK
ncbi:hypothetical protein NQ317_000134 [Molorchus minor]|uniref:Mvd1 C-terminal domain-containing protein n=1 Tax=Molorchus minor TaxID=1323400 RepID=A0ABQ9JVT7_9CUCU|nr:hypothetical protein NQ317_000134 [Molorchus minor]